MNKFGKYIEFDFDPEVSYDPSLIERMKVYNFSLNKLDNCEVWGWRDGDDSGDESDYGLIADFDFEITDTYCRLYFAQPFTYGRFRSDKNKLIVLPRASPLPKGFIFIGCFNMDEHYSAPLTMNHVLNSIDSFQKGRIKMIETLQKDYFKRLFKKKETTSKEMAESIEPRNEDDLPF